MKTNMQYIKKLIIIIYNNGNDMSYNWCFTHIPNTFSQSRMLTDPNLTVYTDGSCFKKRTGAGIVELRPDGDIRMISINGGCEYDINIIEAMAILKYLSDFDENENHLKFVVDTDIVMTRIFQKTRDIRIECHTLNSRRLQKIVEKIVEYITNRYERTTFMHVNSHQGNYGNDLADISATIGRELAPGYCEISYLDDVLESFDV